ncbi:MAG: ribosome-associated translation inhibitor RaiA [Alphaproteobacteria bacterium]|nr:ribosome-associated translation inhibitor RaiA [Alphaproteobacteria bacterium]
MQILVSGKGVEVGESLREHAQAQIDEHVKKYIDRVTSVQVVVSREAHMFRVDITGNLGTHSGLVVRGRGEVSDVYAAFDEALEKVSKQLRRYKRKITNHHKQHDEAPAPANKRASAVKYVLSPEAGEHDEDEKASALVIAEKPTEIRTMTVSEAVMKMDLQDLPALMFFNSAHGRLNVVYRRADGNISWVDPEAKAA